MRTRTYHRSPSRGKRQRSDSPRRRRATEHRSGGARNAPKGIALETRYRQSRSRSVQHSRVRGATRTNSHRFREERAASGSPHRHAIFRADRRSRASPERTAGERIRKGQGKRRHSPSPRRSVSVHVRRYRESPAPKLDRGRRQDRYISQERTRRNQGSLLRSPSGLSHGNEVTPSHSHRESPRDASESPESMPPTIEPPPLMSDKARKFFKRKIRPTGPSLSDIVVDRCLRMVGPLGGACFIGKVSSELGIPANTLTRSFYVQGPLLVLTKNQLARAALLPKERDYKRSRRP